MKILRNLLVSTCLLLLLFACRNKSSNAGDQAGNEFNTVEEIGEVKDIYYRFPSPDEMLNIISEKDLEFDEELPLEPEMAKRYLDSKSQALNLGVYIADLAYITLMQRQKEVLTYFQVVYGLSEKLRISSAYDPALLMRFENNIGNLDSVKALSDAAIIDVNNYLAMNDKDRVFVLISIGGFVESLYLAFQVVGQYSGDNIILQRIGDQKLVLDNLLNYALEYADDKNVSASIELIHPIRAVYNELVASVSETTVSKDSKGKLVVRGGEKIQITEEQFNRLREATNKTRRIITENQEN